MDINLIVWIVFGLITLLVLGFTSLYGFQRTGLQAVVRLVVLVAAVVVAAVLTTAILSASVDKMVATLQQNLAEGDETSQQIVELFSSGDEVATDLKQVVVAMVAPLMFVFIFLAVDILFLIVYAIVGACSFSQGHLKRKAKKHGEVYKTKKFSRAVSILCNFVICFSLAAFLVLPITYYVPLTADIVAMVQDAEEQTAQASESNDTGDTSTVSETSTSSSEEVAILSVLPIEFSPDDLQKVANNPLLNVYGFVGGVVSDNITTMKTEAGTTNLKNFVNGLQPIIGSVLEISQSDTENLSSAQLYALADNMEQNTFADSLLGHLVSQAASKWKNNEQYLGQEPIDFGSEQLNTSIYNTLEGQSKVSESFRAVGHIYSVVQVMQVVGTPSGENAQTSAQIMQSLANNLTPESIEIVSELVSGAVIGELSSVDSGLSEVAAEKVSGAVSNLLTGLYEVKQNNPEKLEAETAAVATVFDVVNKTDSLTKDDAKDVVEAVKESTVLQDVLEEMVTDNENPLNVEVSEETEEQIKQALEENDIEKDSKVYNIVASLFGFTNP